ncbi:MAG: hypothetical protein M3162_06800 [Thermoproteota archaeon]|nr:hypothetical protein [Thermoproteota archaeon]
MYYQSAEAHFSHFAHYNGAGMGISNQYYVNQQMDPEYTKPNELSHIMFSIQDRNGRDTHNVVVMVEVYHAMTGERVSVYPWTRLAIGDFEVPFVFPKVGNYQIVLSMLNEGVSSTQLLNTLPPPRTLLNSNTDCNCERAVFNISVTENFGSIFVMVIFIAIFGVIAVLGVALFWIYWSRRKAKNEYAISNNDFIRYSVLILALGIPIVHLAVFTEHGALRGEYSIFLISASGAQLAYGIMYILLIFSGNSSKAGSQVTKEYYKKSLVLNWFGLAGSLVLILLYLYSVTFPPPLSPNEHPEDVDVAGVVDKSLGIILVIGILYLMRYERKRYLNSQTATSFKRI